MKQEEMLTCPYCGRKAQIRYFEDIYGNSYYAPECTTSNCVGHPEHPTRFSTKEQAIKAWNRRKGE